MTWCVECETDADVFRGRCVQCGERSSMPDTAASAAVVATPASTRGPSGLVIALVVAGVFVALAFASVLVKVAAGEPSSRPTFQLTDYVDVPPQ